MRRFVLMFYRDPIAMALAAGIVLALPMVAVAWLCELYQRVVSP